MADSKDRGAGGSSGAPWVTIGIIGVAILVIAIVAGVILSSSGDDNASGDGTAVLEGSTDPDAQTGTVSIKGGPLPLYNPSVEDPAIGMDAPEFTATDFGGRPHRVEADGKGRVLAFLTHTCPVCDRELPIITEWLKSNELPDNVEVVAISTKAVYGQPNFPPYTWMSDAGYDGIVVRDDESNSLSVNYGLTAYPYTVTVSPEGKVLGRISGALSAEDLSTLAALASGESDEELNTDVERDSTDATDDSGESDAETETEDDADADAEGDAGTETDAEGDGGAGTDEPAEQG